MVRIDLLLSGLTACIALIGYLPLQAYLDPFARLFFPVALLLAVYLQVKGRALPPRVLTPASILLFLYLAAQFSLSNLVPVTSDLLVVFLGVRLMGERLGRNYLQAFALSLFCLAASSLYEISAVFLVYLFSLLLLVAVGLVLLTFHAQDPSTVLPKQEAKRVLTVAALMPVASLPLLLLLFFVLPRTQYPMWNFLNGPAGKKTGLSDTVQPGTSSVVSETKGVVLRAVTPKVPEQKLYWRAVVLNAFKKDAWVREKVAGDAQSVTRGNPVLQEIYPERSATPYLPALNVTRTVTGLRNEAASDAIFVSRRPLDKKVRYLAESVLADTLQTKRIARDFYLKLPEPVSERMRAEGRTVARSGRNAEEKMTALEAFFRGQHLRYANTDLPVGGDPLDAFLFDRKRGNCEYFASCYAILLRLAGVPSRLVGGYRGGTYNDVGGYYVVTEDMAHVWVEAYLDGAGWRTVDPSAWALGTVRSTQAGGLAMYLDMVGFYWDKAVVTYDLDKQIALVRNAGTKARNLRLPPWFGNVLLLSLPVLGGVILLALWYRQRPPTVEARLLRRMLRLLAKRYPGEIKGDEGLFELSARLHDRHLARFAALYGAAVYRDRPLTRGEAAQLEEILREASQDRP
ncbi:transglutaminase family protein [Geomonas agri]|uniref:transglutaminase family protein n=1 Tax=Geomonas agri TaxID=2873702 RepID=UPI001CD574E1|nr:transglutaminaseTgpA domain-containing protein [Geomonas agri]